jgi:Na+/H+ antiporter NhaD/arsenite permease-like protein
MTWKKNLLSLLLTFLLTTLANASDGAHPGNLPPGWLVLPFIALLAMIATGPLFYPKFWHHNYKFIAPGLGILVAAYYLIALHDTHAPVHALAEYISFVSLLTPLFIASGGIMIRADFEGNPKTNLTLLLVGAMLANLIGTTGASMLLIRPFIRLNRDRISPYLIVFFIFFISNLGGSLTPIGDPPLFLGFLKGVPFEWTIVYVLPEWLFAMAALSVFFYIFDSRNKKDLDQVTTYYSGRYLVAGKNNFIFLGIAVLAVFLDPNIFPWIPSIEIQGTRFSFVREVIQLTVGYLSFAMAEKRVLKRNEFSFDPIMEVAFLFIGIFLTMMPALQLIGEFATTEQGKAAINTHSLYWATGFLSSFLDNAPTYVNFLTASMAKYGLDVNNPEMVRAFAAGTVAGIEPGTLSQIYLKAISVASVFFGAMTYIGNGPNFMVKSIAEFNGITMPSFFGYLVRYAIPILLPILFLEWIIFFVIL